MPVASLPEFVGRRRYEMTTQLNNKMDNITAALPRFMGTLGYIDLQGDFPIPRLSLTSNSFTECTIAHIDGENCHVYVVPRIYQPIHLHLCGSLRFFYDAFADDENALAVNDPKPGMFMVTMYEGAYYRGIIQQVLPGDKCLVRFIDNCRFVELPKESIKKLIKKFDIDKIPPLAVRCLDPSLAVGMEAYALNVNVSKEDCPLMVKFVKVYKDKNTGERLPLICVYAVTDLTIPKGFVNLSRRLLESALQPKERS